MYLPTRAWVKQPPTETTLRGFGEPFAAPFYLGGSPTVPRIDPLRRLICNAPADLNSIAAALGRPAVTIAEVRTILGTAIQQSVSWLQAAARALERSRRNNATRQIFRAAFDTLPESIPNWRKPGETWDRGDIVRRRLLSAANILAGGYMNYYCWGPNHQPGWGWDAGTYAMVQAGRYRIYLGRAFWNDGTAQQEINRTSTLVHEALHIYYETVVDPAGTYACRTRYGNAFCYERYVLQFNGIAVPAFVQTCCAHAGGCPGYGACPARP